MSVFLDSAPLVHPSGRPKLRTAVPPKAKVRLALAGSSSVRSPVDEQGGWGDDRVRREEEAGSRFVSLSPVSSHIPTHPTFQDLLMTLLTQKWNFYVSGYVVEVSWVCFLVRC